MTEAFAGGYVEQPPGPKYAASLRFAELGVRPPLPKPQTLARWRKTMPDDFLCSLVAPWVPSIATDGSLNFEGGSDALDSWIVPALQAIHASALVIKTSPELTPSRRNKERLAAFLQKTAELTTTDIVWSPSGLWEPEESSQIAEEYGALVAMDPLQDPDVLHHQSSGIQTAPRDTHYLRLRAMGVRSRFSEDSLHNVAHWLTTHEAKRAYIALHSPRAFTEACRLQDIVGAVRD